MNPCVHREDCGGCIYQEIPYEEQLILKAKDLLRHFANNQVEVENFLGIEGSPQRYSYRNKMEYSFGDEVKDGDLTLGLHKAGHYFSVFTTDSCQLVDEDFNLILKATLKFCRDKAYSYYHKKSREGLLRHLIIRKGHRTGELLVNIVTSTQGKFDTDEYVDAIDNLQLGGTVVGILHTENDNLADAVICDKLNILRGRDYYLEELMGLRFRVSAFSFFQTNVDGAERLYTEAISLVEKLEGKTLYDLYSGTGTIAQAAALRAKKVIGVEIVEDAVKSAIENAKDNGLDNCSFIAGDVLKVLNDLTEKPDLIFFDPPRAGVAPKALEKILAYGVNEMVYISCNPKSLAENLSTARLFDYKVKTLKAYDNFPFTKHIEAVTLLHKISS